MKPDGTPSKKARQGGSTSQDADHGCRDAVRSLQTTEIYPWPVTIDVRAGEIWETGGWDERQ